MPRTFYCLFDTMLGACAIAWKEGQPTPAGIAVTRLQLPDSTAGATEELLIRKTQGTRSEVSCPFLAGILRRVGAHLAGEPQDFSDIPVDFGNIRSFSRQVYTACRQIPAGRTVTYGELARMMDHPGAARAVGQALARNPVPLIVPCHRVLSADSKPGGFSAPGGVKTKVRMLALEGVRLDRAGTGI